MLRKKDIIEDIVVKRLNISNTQTDWASSSLDT